MFLDRWFTVAHAFGLDPHEIQQTWSHSQMVDAWQWLQQQWNRPSRSDYYTMLVVDAVRSVLSRKAHKINLDKIKIPFGQTGTSSTFTPEELDDIAMARWLGMLGGSNDVR